MTRYRQRMSAGNDDEQSGTWRSSRTFIRNMKRLRAEQGLSLSALSLKMNIFSTGAHPSIHPDSLSRLESGKRKIGIDEAAAIAEVLGVSPAELCGWDVPAADEERAQPVGRVKQREIGTAVEARADVVTPDVEAIAAMLRDAVRLAVREELDERGTDA